MLSTVQIHVSEFASVFILITVTNQNLQSTSYEYIYLFQSRKAVHEYADTEEDNAESSYCSRSRFHNRRKLNEQDLKNLHPHLRSKYLAVCRYVSFFKIAHCCYSLLAYQQIITFSISMPNA